MRKTFPAMRNQMVMLMKRIAIICMPALCSSYHENMLISMVNFSRKRYYHTARLHHGLNEINKCSTIWMKITIVLSNVAICTDLPSIEQPHLLNLPASRSSHPGRCPKTDDLGCFEDLLPILKRQCPMLPHKNQLNP